MSNSETNTEFGLGKRIGKAVLNNGGYFAGLIILLLFYILSPPFRSFNNFVSIIRDNSSLLVASIGMTFVLISGRMDLSISGSILCSASVGALLMDKFNMNPYLAIAITLLIGTLIGAVNGFFIVVLRTNAWLTTLSMQLGLRGLALILTHSNTLILPNAFKIMRRLKVFRVIPVYALVAVLLTVVAQIILKYTVFGRKVVATGNDEAAAKRLGINTDLIRFEVYTLCGFTAGIAGVLLAINMGVVGTTSGGGYNFLAMMAIVLGGASLSGGKGSVFPGTLFGILVIGCLENGLSTMGINPYIFGILRGAIIYYAVLIDSLKNKSLV